MFQELYFLREILLLFRGQVMSDSGTPWSVAHQGLLCMAFLRQEYWSRLPFPPPGDPPESRTKPVFPALKVDFFFFFFTAESPEKPFWGRTTTNFNKPSKIYRIYLILYNTHLQCGTWVRSLGWDDCLEKGTARSSILA